MYLKIRITRFLFSACLMLLPITAMAAEINPPTLKSKQGAWPIRRQWTQAETQHYAAWIQNLYDVKANGTQDQRLAKLEALLTDPKMNLLLDPAFAGEDSNPDLDRDTIRALHNVLDCGKLTVVLSTYYAYRRALPWMVSRVRACDGGDLRTADYTIPVGQISSFEYDKVGRFFRDAVTGTCTGNFRVEVTGEHADLSDTLPVEIVPEHLIPGCLYYMDGHVLIFARIDPYGEPFFLDSTTAASRDIYAFNGFNTVSGLSPKHSDLKGNEYKNCYYGFRVNRWPLAEVDDTGTVTKVRRRTNEEMIAFGFSTEQYDKLEELATSKRIVEEFLNVDDFHEFIRFRMRAKTKISPVTKIKEFAEAMRVTLNERERRVQEAWRETNEKGPILFPENHSNGNVFTARGRWGQHASALNDSAWRAKYFQLAECLDHAIAWFEPQSEDMEFDELYLHSIETRADLADVVLRIKDRVFGETTFEYLNSAGKPVRLSLLDIEKRLYDLSFDPNQPPELRWGAPLGSPEAQSATSRPTPLPDGKPIPMEEAYRRQAYYRSLTHWEPDESYLRSMFTEGFPLREKINQFLRIKWIEVPSVR